MSTEWDAAEHLQALIDDAMALANTIVGSMLDDPEGAAPHDVIDSIVADLIRDLPDGTLEEVQRELTYRCIKVTVVVEVMARMVVGVIRAAEREGLRVQMHVLSSPYDVLRTLDGD
jgi:hypothetical protein